MSWFDLFYFNELRTPWALLLLIGVAVLLVAEGFARAPGAVVISTGETLARVGGAAGLWRRWGPALLRAIGLTLLVFALARPLNGYQLRQDRADVIDIMLCVDVSGSMRQEDYQIGNRYLDRLTVAKAAVRDFIESRKQRRGDRFGVDRIGLVLYRGIAWTQTPLTLDYGVLEYDLQRAVIDESDPEENGTAIGSAIGLAVRRLSQSEAKSKVIILLTDGLNNRGELDPITAANIAKDYGIRIYSIGAGASSPNATPFGMLGGFMQVQADPIDAETLQKIAEISGGRFYRAEDIDSLKQAYAEIDQLETTEIDLNDYYEYKEAFLPYALLGTVMTLAAVLVRRRWCETIP